MIDYTIKAVIGEDCSDIKMSDPKGYWSYYAIHSSQSGVLKEITIDESVKKNNIVESHLNYKLGNKVSAFLVANGSIGILIMKFDSMAQMLEMMDHSDKWIKVIVE